MDKTKSILIVDDDTKLTELVSGFLQENDYEVYILHDGLDAEEQILKLNPALVVLDVMLPGRSGLEICRSVRAQYNGMILMLTALEDDIDEVAGLEIGADDYLAKPVRPRVLLAHIRALLRRDERQQPEPMEITSRRAIEINGLRIDRGSREVSRNGKLIELTTAEFDLLWFLMEKCGKVVGREELHEHILRIPYDGLDRTIDLRISRLRKKLEDDSSSPVLIKTVRGSGYLLADSQQ